MFKGCLFCQRPIHYQTDWRNLIDRPEQRMYCLQCVHDKILVQNSLVSYLFQNHYHLRHYLSEVIAQRVDYKRQTIYTIAYPRKELNLYDEMYAIVSLLTAKCYSLTPTKINGEKRNIAIKKDAICLAFEHSKETQEYSQLMPVILITELLDCHIQNETTIPI